MAKVNSKPPFFHVAAAFKGDGELVELFTDLSQANLKAHFIIPYKGGKTILIGSSLFDLRDIASVVIVKTYDAFELAKMKSNAAEQIKVDEWNRSTPGLVRFPTVWLTRGGQLANLDENVTSEFITGPPGESSLIIRIIQNTWVVTIAGGVILVIIGYYITQFLG